MRLFIHSILAIIISLEIISCEVKDHKVSYNNTSYDQSVSVESSDLEYVKSQKSDSNILMHKEGFDISYNKKTNLPNWVSWKINKLLLNGPVKNNEYYSDKQLPYANQISPLDYPNIGYNMGHMCPISNMSWNRKANAYVGRNSVSSIGQNQSLMSLLY